MYLLSVIAVFALFLLYCAWVVDFRFHFLSGFFHFPTLMVIVLSPIPILALNRLLKDFGNAFLFVRNKKEAESLMELKRAQKAVNLTKNTVLAFAVFIAFVQGVLALYLYSDPSSAGYLLVPILLSMVYGMLGVLLLQPLQTALDIKILEQEDEICEENRCD
ncbi:MAG: hypothetical protein NC429_04515 [Lachnospiraceae bacterium]|nr:hypothetical protein [Lachnospiraceae bacterium]